MLNPVFAPVGTTLLQSDMERLIHRFDASALPRNQASALGRSSITRNPVETTTNEKKRLIQTVDTRALIKSWHTINSTIAAGMRSKIGVMKRQHLDLFEVEDRKLASQIFDRAVMDVSAETAYRRAKRAEQTLRRLDRQAAEQQKAAA